MPTDPVAANILEGVEKTIRVPGSAKLEGKVPRVRSWRRPTPCPDHLVQYEEHGAGDPDFSWARLNGDNIIVSYDVI